MSPLTGAFDPLLERTHRVQILTHLLLVRLAQTVIQAFGIIQHNIQHTGVPLQPCTDLFRTGSRIRLKHSIEDFLRFLHGGDRPARAVMGKRFGVSVRASAALGAEHEGWEASLATTDLCCELIDGDVIGLLSTSH